MYKNSIKAFIITVMNFLICFFIAISSFADYSITQLTDNDYDDYSPQINNRGEVVWYADEGNGFDPEELKNPLEPENLLNENGRGIFLIKNLMDKLDFKFTDNGTEVIVKKYLK